MRILITLVGILALIIVGLLIAPTFIPSEVYRAQIETRASAALGRQVSVGEVKLSLFPRIEARAGETRIDNPEGFDASSPFAEMTDLRAAVKLFPLLVGRVDIDEFILVDPSISLVRKANGEANWEFGGGATPTSAPEDDGSNGGSGGVAATFGDVRLINGRIEYDDRSSDTQYLLEDLNISASMPSMAKPLKIDGDGVLDGVDFKLNGRLDNAKTLQSGGPAATQLDFESALADIDFKGETLLGDTPSISGELDLDLPDLRALAALGDVVLPEGDVYQQFSLSGQASGDANRLALTGAKIDFDDISGEGDIALRLTGKPKISGAFSTGVIDATPYAAASGAAESGGGAGSSTPSSGLGGGWGETPLELSVLNTIDADLTLSAAGVRFQDFDIGRSEIALTIVDGRLVADLRQIALYGGQGSARLTADASRRTPEVALKADLQGLKAQPFLNAAAGFDRLLGGGGVSLDIKGSGATLDAVMKSLSGQGRFAFADGAIEGVNLAQLVRSAQEALTTGALPAALSDEAETDFTDLGASFTLNNGVASTNDLSMLSPFLNVGGEGFLDIGRQKLNLSLFPESKDGEFGIGGYGIPIRVSGHWTNISAGLDVDWLTNRAGGLLADTLQDELSDQLSDAVGGELDSVLGGIIGGALGQSPAAETPAEAAPSEAEQPAEAEQPSLEDELSDAFGELFRRD